MHPGLDLKADKLRLGEVIEKLRAEARERVSDAGLELLGQPTAMVVEGTAITLDDPRVVEEYTWGPSVGIFVEVHVRNPHVGDGKDPGPNL